MAEKRVEKEIERRKPNMSEHIKGVKFHTLAKGVTTHPLIRSGKPRIEGTGIKVSVIASLLNHHNIDAEQIADHLWLELDMVQNALNYYADHKQYIDVCNQLSSINGRQMMESPYGDKTRELLSRRESFTQDPRAVEHARH